VTQHIDNNSKVAVVIVAGRGIGKAIAKEFAKNGYCIMINDFEKEEKLKNTAEEISIIAGNNHNSKVAYIIGDVSQEQTCINLMEQTINIFGRIDVLINNASIAEKTAVRETNHTSRSSSSSPTNLDTSQYKQASSYFTLEEYEIADTSLKGLYLCIREAAKRMIIQSLKEEEEMEVPFHRIGQPEEIARIALFLASEDASYITGSLVYADGGLSLSRSNYFLESKIEQD
jgi:NAD(P)-dependent dehydrogenase (short-subunit alcohol dehydrogenase family)